MKENEGEFKQGEGKKRMNKSIRVIDFPGAQRLRSGYRVFVSSSRAIIFLIDAVEFPRQSHLVAEFLYDLFVDKAINELKPTIFIVANKMDLLTAKPIDEIKPVLLKHLNDTRKSRKSMRQTGEDDEDDITLGIEGEPLQSFDQIPLRIKWGQSSTKNEKLLSPVTDFISQLFR